MDCAGEAGDGKQVAVPHDVGEHVGQLTLEAFLLLVVTCVARDQFVEHVQQRVMRQVVEVEIHPLQHGGGWVVVGGEGEQGGRRGGERPGGHGDVEGDGLGSPRGQFTDSLDVEIDLETVRQRCAHTGKAVVEPGCDLSFDRLEQFCCGCGVGGRVGVQIGC